MRMMKVSIDQVTYIATCNLFFPFSPLCCFVRHSSATLFSLCKKKTENGTCSLHSDYRDSKTEIKL